jgi:hypothetical protein
MGVLLLTALLAIGSPPGVQCRNVQLKPSPRLFHAPAWDYAGERLLIVDIVGGELGVYATSGERERAISKPGPEKLDFSTPVAIAAAPQGYVLRDGTSRFVSLDRNLKPVRVDELNPSKRSPKGSEAAAFQWAPFQEGVLAYGDLRLEGGKWRTGVYKAVWGSPVKFEFLREMSASGDLNSKQPYLLTKSYLARLGERAYLFSFDPAYGLIEIDDRGTRLLGGLPAGFGTIPQMPPSRGRQSMPATYKAFSNARGVVGLSVIDGSLYLLLRDVEPDGRRRWLMAEYDPVKQKTVATFLLPASSEHVELTAGRKWLAVFDKGAVLADERFSSGAVTLVPVDAFRKLHGAGGTVDSPIRLCRP